jgi:DNA-binding transcriptional LysR family regulator
MRYFVAVADELHFGRAADKLHISQPPLSQQIQDLERELGVALFHRTRHFVALTEAGRAFLEEVRRILQDSDHAVMTARKAGQGEVGHLSLGFGPSSEAGVVGKVLKAFLSHHTNVIFDLHTLRSREQIEALVDRRIDVAFPILPITHRDVATELMTAKAPVVALPTAHPLARASHVRLADLRSAPFVRISPDGGFHDFVLRACTEAGFAPSVAHEAGHVLTVLGMVGAGLGVAILPGPLRPAEGVEFRPLRGAPRVQHGVAYRRHESSPLLLAFLDVVRDVLQRKPAPPLLRERTRQPLRGGSG